MVRAVAALQFGGPEVLSVLDVPREPLESGQIRLRVAAAGVNPTDTRFLAGEYQHYYPDYRPPYIPGVDVAGDVTEVGAGVEHVAVGDLVMGMATTPGTYREDKVLSADWVHRAPAGADAIAASTLPCNGLTALFALQNLDLRPGQTLGVTGAAGAVGGFAVQLAKAQGLRVIADASPADEALVRSLGADVVVERGDAVAANMRAHAPVGVDGLLDASLQNATVLPAVADGGGVATVRESIGPPSRGIRYFPSSGGAIPDPRAAMRYLVEQVEAGALTLRVARALPAEAAAEAHQQLARGGVRGRLVLTF